jgi:hypothetical protein
MNSIEIKPIENRVDIQHAGNDIAVSPTQNDITLSTFNIFTTVYFLSPFQPAERHEEVKK